MSNLRDQNGLASLAPVPTPAPMGKQGSGAVVATASATGTKYGLSPQGEGPGEDSTVTCPDCGRDIAGKLFCPSDGHLAVESFVVGERYVVNKRLGSGGTAFVFGGHHVVLGKSVAIKVLRAEHAEKEVESQRFLRAARLGGQLQHENIVVVHDFGKDETTGLVYLVMEHLRGQTMAEVIREEGPFAPERALPILVQLARALGAAHEEDILHRDLNPRNVVLTTTSGRPDVVKLCDFGLSRTVVGQDRVTMTGLAVGTPAYMAPEQVRGDDAQGAAIDVYALGVTAYEMLSGRLPHEAPTSVAMIASKLRDEPVALSLRMPDGVLLPTELDKLIMSCLSTDPAERPESISAVEAALLSLGESSVDLCNQIVGNYQVIRELGRGGMSIAYLAQHQVIGNKAALKVINAELAADRTLVNRFVQEARASSEIDSQAIPRYYDFGTLPDGRSYALMEYVEGQSVASRLAHTGPFGLAETKEIVRQCATALEAAHKVGIVHRDLKPEHIMLCPREHGFQVKILDFGIAKNFGGTATAKTKVGSFMGTPAYCAPEQVLGEAISPATDVYALGACIFEMLCGRAPFFGEIGQVLAIKTNRDPEPLNTLRPEVPQVVSDGVATMMHRTPINRPTSMRDVLSLVGSWPDEVEGSQRDVSRSPWPARFLGLAILGVLVVGVATSITSSEVPTDAPENSRLTDDSPPVSDPKAVLGNDGAKDAAPNPPEPTIPEVVATPHAEDDKEAEKKHVETTPKEARAKEPARPQSPERRQASKIRKRPKRTPQKTTPRPKESTNKPARSQPKPDIIIADPFQ